MHLDVTMPGGLDTAIIFYYYGAVYTTAATVFLALQPFFLFDQHTFLFLCCFFVQQLAHGMCNDWRKQECTRFSLCFFITGSVMVMSWSLQSWTGLERKKEK